MKKVLLFLALLVIAMPTAFAQEATTSPKRPAEIRKEMIQSNREDRKEMKGELRQLTAEDKEELQAAREELKKKLDEDRELFRTRIEKKREELKAKIQKKRQDLQEKLKKIKDEQKQKIVLRINDQLDALNDRMMKLFSATLDTLDKVTQRISDRATALGNEGKDVTAVKNALQKAAESIAAARAGIVTQSGKTYTITISGTETKLGDEVSKARKTLHDDIQKVKDLVDSARVAVRKAAVALAALTGVELSSPSPSPSVSPSTSPSPTATATPTNEN